MNYKDCPFCTAIINDRLIVIQGEAAALKDNYPVTPEHTLIIPLRHTPTVFDLTEGEREDVWKLLEILRERILSEDPSVTGFNIGANAGRSAGQTVGHCHIHLIPRRDGDTPDPAGGVRGVIPGKRRYEIKNQDN